MAYIDTLDANLPQIYAYETPGVEYHDGWIKVGDTDRDFEQRIKEQTYTAGIVTKNHLLGFSIYSDGSNKTFSDKDFHKFLRGKGVNDQHPKFPGDEWFELSYEDLEKYFWEFTHKRTIERKIDMALRDEQEEAITKTVEYNKNHENGEFLWNAKPRFGKTIAAMEFCKRINAKNVLVLTNMPAVANSWYQDYCEYLGPESGYIFVSSTSDLNGKEHVVSREDYINMCLKNEKVECKCFEFVSLQDLKGSIYYGGKYDKLGELQNLEWDALFLDEAHEGVDTLKTEFALDKIRRKFTLHLSGTPFKQIKNNKFDTDAIFNWTYVDEQKRKVNWTKDENNPYESLPTLNMSTYRMSNIIETEEHASLDNDEMEYAYKLNRFFETKDGKFIHREAVIKFLNTLTQKEDFPMSSKKKRKMLAHSFWLLPSRDACKAMETELKNHEIFKEYEIINVAVDSLANLKNASEYENENAAYGIVRAAIENHSKTITLSVQRLTTGVTIPEWTSVFILSEIQSPQTYMQAAFRAQNPCIFNINGTCYRKKNSYVFDFNPERSLNIIEQFANDLYSETTDGQGTTEERKNNIIELLKYFPVSGEDEEGRFRSLTADDILSIPRTIRCKEVVRLGFMCNFLFSNDFSGIFRAPSVVTEILNQLSTPKNMSRKSPIDISPTASEDMCLDKDGNIDIPENKVLEYAERNMISQRELETIAETEMAKFDVLSRVATDDEKRRKEIKKIDQNLSSQIASGIINAQKETGEVSKSLEAGIKNKVLTNIEQISKNTETDKNIEILTATKSIENDAGDCTSEELVARLQSEKERIEKKYAKIKEQRILEAINPLKLECSNLILNDRAKKEKNKKEDEIREHLKGFARTVPSFLMAYGDDTTTLKTFEENIPANVFKDVTSITIEEFRFLRDGGLYKETDGTEGHFNGHVFEETVFNDAIKEFMKKKKELSNYFEESQKEDIFDYIPPQRTNQIYTPKNVVKQMVDMLEENCPGCFDSDEKTFIDLYMKSGLYIAEIVKRLYNNPNIIRLHPDKNERLQHIFKHQVYGLAPTEIIHRIALSFVLGFNDDIEIKEHNLRQFDATPYAKDGTLKEELGKLFPDT